MRYAFKNFWHIEPRKHSANGDGTFIYKIMYAMYDNLENKIVTDVAEIGVTGNTTNSETDPFILQNIQMRINAMWNKNGL